MIHHTIFTWSAEPAGVDDSQSAMIQMICIDLVAAEGSPILGMCSNTKKRSLNTCQRAILEICHEDHLPRSVEFQSLRDL